MAKSLKLVSCLFALLCFTGPVAGAGSPERFSEPSKVENELTGYLVQGEANRLAARASALVGAPEQRENLEKAFSYISGKKADYFDVVYDKAYGTSLRRIVTLASYSDLTFLYIRYTFKRTATGWILSNYDFKTETQQLFPSGYEP